MRSHYLYESSFTRVGKEGAHEKGGIEGDVGRFRRGYLVPVPEVSSLQELNDLIAAACITDLRRTIRGRQQTSAVGPLQTAAATNRAVAHHLVCKLSGLADVSPNEIDLVSAGQRAGADRAAHAPSADDRDLHERAA